MLFKRVIKLKKTKFIDFKNVDIPEGFWNNRQTINANTTIQSIYNKFNATGRFEAAKLNWREGMPNRPHIFWDSDIAKWIEAVAYIHEKHKKPELIKLCDDIIDIIESKQEDTGYYNIHFQTCESHARFTRRTDHELYCAGHFIEAAVAYYEATGKDKLLKIVCKYIDYIEKEFCINKTAKFVTPGHEEIELALVKLYHCTGERKYLELSKFFIDERGKHDEKSYEQMTKYYAQDHLPVREQTTAEGHSVRACYLYTAMADLALEYNDLELKNACEAIFNNILEKKMYITGGIGSTYYGEAFSIDYDLPNDIAYAESCAAISLAFFAKRMLDLDLNSKYADVIERILYNGFLSSISLNGKAFFYKNPLEIIPQFKDRFPSTTDIGHVPEFERLEVFECSCCPPNISRFFATIGGYIYSEIDNMLAVHQYISSEGKNISMKSSFPNNGKVQIKASEYSKLAIRIPDWCENYTISNKNNVEIENIEKGYLIIKCTDKNISLDIEFEMPVVLMECNPEVTQNSGKVCCMRGPIVYCAEKVDNKYKIHELYLSDTENVKLNYNDDFYAYEITLNGYVKQKTNSLYYRYNDNFEKTDVKLIPYYCFANRGISEMMVWLNKK